MSKYQTIIGSIYELESLKNSPSGRPNYIVTINTVDGDLLSVRTKNDYSYNYSLQNFRNDNALLKVHYYEYYGELAIEKIEVLEVKHKKGASLEWPQLWEKLNMKKDSAGRWEYTSKTPFKVRKYLNSYRSPSRAYPLSYAKALLTIKFAKWLCEEMPGLAVSLNVAEIKGD